MRVGLMKRRELVDLLADYADALNEGDDDAARWLDNHVPLKSFSSFVTLLQLAQAVKEVLVPVTPSPSFQVVLKDQLTQSDIVIEEKWPFPKTILVGTAVSVIGLTIYLLHRFRPADDGVVTAV